MTVVTRRTRWLDPVSGKEADLPKEVKEKLSSTFLKVYKMIDRALKKGGENIFVRAKCRLENLGEKDPETGFPMATWLLRIRFIPSPLGLKEPVIRKIGRKIEDLLFKELQITVKKIKYHQEIPEANKTFMHINMPELDKSLSVVTLVLEVKAFTGVLTRKNKESSKNGSGLVGK